MDYFNWELSVLSRAVAYNNLSGASQHVGLSQPQLSRIINKIEKQYDINLLDRSAKRKSTWTPVAFKLAKTYTQAHRSLFTEIQQLSGDSEPDHIRIGTLEGLSHVAIDFSNHILKGTKAKVIECDIFDLNGLEEGFFKGNFDFIFTFREPGRKKFKYLKTLGYQTMNGVTEGESEIKVLSSFEFETQISNNKKGFTDRIFVSNSLAARKEWIEKFGGKATMPSNLKAKATKAKDEVAVYLIGSDILSAGFWEKATTANLDS